MTKLSLEEVARRMRIMNAADGYPPPSDQLGALKEDCNAPAACDIAGDWLQEPDEPDLPIVAGLIDEGDRVGIVAQSKGRKSFFAMLLALSVATGTPFFGYAVTSKRVLLVNGEIRRAPYKKRLRRMVERMRIAPAALSGLIVFNSSDQVPDEDPLGQTLKLAKDHRCEFVVLDPFYLCIGDEADQAEVKRAIITMKLFAVEGVTLVSVFHSSKGNIGDRQTIDRISGSGVFARDVSTLLTLAEHATEPNHIVMTAVCRNHPPHDPQTIRFDDGCFESTSVAPVEKTSRTRPVRVIGKDEVAACFSAAPLSYADACAAVKRACCVGMNRAKELIAEAVQQGIVSAIPDGRRMNYTAKETV